MLFKHNLSIIDAIYDTNTTPQKQLEFSTCTSMVHC